MKKVIRVGTRESELALVQSRLVVNEIKSKHPDLEFELVGMKTSGDVMLDERLDKVGGKGLFIKEIEYALLNRSIDIAVHSMKDLPAYLPDELTIAAVSKREDPRDVLVTVDGKLLEELKPGSVIGTSSLRREIQILRKRPDLTVKTLRGNVLTRINKLLNHEYDALILAAAGLKRLGLHKKCVQYFEVDDVIPAVGQGILAIETRKDDDAGYLIDSVHNEESALQLAAERTFMIRLNGGCSTPIAAHAVIDGERMIVFGMRAHEGSTRCCRAYVEGNKRDALKLGEKLADIVLEQGK